jgi:hypothetical protein
MLKRQPVVVLALAACLAAGAGTAAAGPGGGLKKPPASNATLTISPSQVDSESVTTLTFTLNVGTVPTPITGGAVEIDAPSGWSFDTDAAVNEDSTCDVSGATASSGGQVARVAGVSCSTGQTLLLDVTATAPAAETETAYLFGSSIKSNPGSRKTKDNVYLTAKATELVAPVSCGFC